MCKLFEHLCDIFNLKKKKIYIYLVFGVTGTFQTFHMDIVINLDWEVLHCLYHLVIM